MDKRSELISKLQSADLLKLTKSELDGACQSLGISARGTREELIERLHRFLWR